MIEAEHAVTVGTDIDQVWEYVRDINRWALLFPGCREYEAIDDRRSRWVIKVGAGGLVKTVNVLVDVDRWDGPGSVEFSYRLETEPVTGSGSYLAVSQGGNATDIMLHLRVQGAGQAAPMWEALSRPLLPQMARSFANELKSEIEKASGLAAPAPAKASLVARIWRWLRTVLGIGPTKPLHREQ